MRLGDIRRMKSSLLYVPLKRIGLAAGALFLFIAHSNVRAAVHDPSATPGPIAGTARIVDGDTIELDGVRIRLEGIDAPELSQTCERSDGASWACGQKAASKLRDLVADNDVLCDETGKDKYHRTLAICYADGLNINEEMVRSGFALAFVKYSRRFEGVEAEARAAKIGVWQGRAEAPWDYRHRDWQTAERDAPGGCAIKGNISSKGRIYHMPWSAWYGNVKINERRGERWFCSEGEAVAAGWRPARAN